MCRAHGNDNAFSHTVQGNLTRVGNGDVGRWLIGPAAGVNVYHSVDLLYAGHVRVSAVNDLHLMVTPAMNRCIVCDLVAQSQPFLARSFHPPAHPVMRIKSTKLGRPTPTK